MREPVLHPRWWQDCRSGSAFQILTFCHGLLQHILTHGAPLGLGKESTQLASKYEFNQSDAGTWAPREAKGFVACLVSI